MKKFIIKKESSNEYVNRELKKKMKIVSIGLTIFLLIIFAFTFSYGIHLILMPPLIFLFLIILAVVYAAGLVQIRNVIDTTYYLISVIPFQY
mgnify:CR=1 FL=1